VGTPIGNLADMTPRAIEVLRGVAAIAAEDTRRVRGLLSHFAIPHPARMISYREENRDRAGEEILGVLRGGGDVALVSDAGMPAVSDPGEAIVDRCHEEGFRVCPIPGPSAVLCALAASGLPSRRFTFEGFLSRRASHRRAHLESLRGERRTMIFLEAPSRVAATLAELGEVLGGERRACAARELTKMFEEIRRDTLNGLAGWSAAAEMRGEFTLVVEGAEEAPPPQAPDRATLEAELEALMRAGQNRRQAAKALAARYGLDARALYRATSPPSSS
jgi:16S rRNA (cytidine1402-2'-O)-methyltransferase